LRLPAARPILDGRIEKVCAILTKRRKIRHAIVIRGTGFDIAPCQVLFLLRD
jgi:hypothetical protein